MNILWLASWFPNRTGITNGDFIERHAKAVAPFVDSLTIIAAVKDEQLPYNAVDIVERKESNITAYIIYYGRSRWGGATEKFLSLKKYVSLQLDLFEKIKNEKGLPGLVHVHVAMKSGLVAKKIKRQYNIPYIVTEHWTGYYKEAQPNIFETGSYFARQAKSVLKNASLLLTVSNDLGNAISKNLLPVAYKVVPNVVDTNLFSPSERTQSNSIKLVHISNMLYQKNAEAIIEALAIWKKRGGEFSMQVFGPTSKAVALLVEKNGLQSEVTFNGEVLQAELCDAVKQADALVLYSRYETFGCVIIEANACGTPVIVSDIPVFHELVTEKENGVFVQQDKPGALATAFENFDKTKSNFNRERIAAAAKERFCYNTVGRQIREVYNEVLETNQWLLQ